MVTRSTGGRLLAVLVMTIAVLLSTGCATVELTAGAPDGFAPFERQSPDERFRAVSADGITYRVRYVDNEPTQDAGFWRDAVHNQLTVEGYELIDQGTFEATGGEGFFLAWVAPVGTADYVYLTAFFVEADWIVIVESAGEYQRFNEYRDAIIDSLVEISISD